CIMLQQPSSQPLRRKPTVGEDVVSKIQQTAAQFCNNLRTHRQPPTESPKSAVSMATNKTKRRIKPVCIKHLSPRWETGQKQERKVLSLSNTAIGNFSKHSLMGLSVATLVLLTAARLTDASTVREFNFNASDRLPSGIGGPNESAVSAVALSPGSIKLVGPVGMNASWLGSLQCATKCRAWAFCHAYYFNASAGLCHLADQGQFETYWTGNGTAGKAAFVKLYHDICTWQSWTNWATASGATGDSDICNALVNRTRVRQCTCPTDEGASVSGWCQGAKDKSQTQGSFISWCQWSEWATDSSEGSLVCGNWNSRHRSRSCRCPIDRPPETIETAAVDNITQFTRRRVRKCGCSTPISASAGPEVSSESDTAYTAWCDWGNWGNWYKDCKYNYKIVRSRTRTYNDCTRSSSNSCSREWWQREAGPSCGWKDWSSWQSWRHCRSGKAQFATCRCEDDEAYNTATVTGYRNACHARCHGKRYRPGLCKAPWYTCRCITMVKKRCIYGMNSRSPCYFRCRGSVPRYEMYDGKCCPRCSLRVNEPVCGSRNQTYRNGCFARCNGDWITKPGICRAEVGIPVFPFAHTGRNQFEQEAQPVLPESEHRPGVVLPELDEHTGFEPGGHRQRQRPRTNLTEPEQRAKQALRKPQQKQQPSSSSSTQKKSGGVAFEVALDSGNVTPRSRKPHHLERRLGDDARPTTPDLIAKRQREAEARRKKQEAETIKRVGRHNDRVERLAREAEQRKKDEEDDD
uniref:Kazal-like domain-containing protein n=1 Tax=Macrostomum lignano TaxID=282301 RepID=A0A1I8H5Y9_9PLAT